MDCTIYVAKIKALISFAVTAKLICVFVFAYAKSRFSHDAAQMLSRYLTVEINNNLFFTKNTCVYIHMIKVREHPGYFVK